MMSRYEPRPSVDELCRGIIANGAIDVREWMAAHADDLDAMDDIEGISRPFYEAGAEGCWVVEGEPDAYGCGRFETMIVRLPKDPKGRRRCHSVLSEHLYARADATDSPELYHEDSGRYYGEEFCLVRLDPIEP
jgi:hypothetical protein